MDLVEIRPTQLDADAQLDLTSLKGVPIEKSASLVSEERPKPTPQVHKHDSFQNGVCEEAMGQSNEQTAQRNHELNVHEERAPTPHLLIGYSPRE